MNDSSIIILRDKNLKFLLVDDSVLLINTNIISKVNDYLKSLGLGIYVSYIKTIGIQRIYKNNNNIYIYFEASEKAPNSIFIKPTNIPNKNISWVTHTNIPVCIDHRCWIDCVYYRDYYDTSSYTYDYRWLNTPSEIKKVIFRINEEIEKYNSNHKDALYLSIEGYNRLIQQRHHFADLL